MITVSSINNTVIHDEAPAAIMLATLIIHLKETATNEVKATTKIQAKAKKTYALIDALRLCWTKQSCQMTLSLRDLRPELSRI